MTIRVVPVINREGQNREVAGIDLDRMVGVAFLQSSSQPAGSFRVLSFRVLDQVVAIAWRKRRGQDMWVELFGGTKSVCRLVYSGQ